VDALARLDLDGRDAAVVALQDEVDLIPIAGAPMAEDES